MRRPTRWGSLTLLWVLGALLLTGTLSGGPTGRLPVSVSGTSLLRECSGVPGAQPQGSCGGGSGCLIDEDCPCGATCMWDGTCDLSTQELDGCTPILIPFSQSASIHLTSAQNGVWFDIEATGLRHRVAWTQAGDMVGFLVLDRNGNGFIDDGKELFGNVTPVPGGGTAPNGFEALAAYDRPENGGNGDGLINAQDTIWSQLRIWIDLNHNGISESSEIFTLAQRGLTEISLDYITTNRRDEHGNVLRLKAKCNVSGKVRFGYDVYFTVRPPSKTSP